MAYVCMELAVAIVVNLLKHRKVIIDAEGSARLQRVVVDDREHVDVVHGQLFVEFARCVCRKMLDSNYFEFGLK